jgi:transcriptional regulator with XRE-family HTH domain
LLTRQQQPTFESVVLRNLAVIRALVEMKQRQVADVSGLHQQTLSEYERGMACLNPRHAEAIAEALGVPVLALTEPIIITDGKVRLAREAPAHV